MRERALLVDGELEVAGAAEGGTRVRLSVPVAAG
jgi:signal transduction histidine kinase